MATISRLRVTKIGNLGCPNHGGELCLCMKSLDMILNRGDILGFHCLVTLRAKCADCGGGTAGIFGIFFDGKASETTCWEARSGKWRLLAPSLFPSWAIFPFSPPSINCVTVREVAEVRVRCCSQGSAG